PRARGLPRGRRARVLRARSLPACAELTAPERSCASTATVHPRMRGAYPEAVEHASYVLGPSPRARGTTSVTWHLTNDKQLFLQLLENPTNQTHHAQRSTLATKYTTHPEAPLPTPARLGHHSGSVRPPRIRQRSTSTQRFVQRTPPHTSRTQSLTTHRHIAAFPQRLRHHVIQLGDLFMHRKGSLRYHLPHRRRRGTRTQQPIQTPKSSIHLRHWPRPLPHPRGKNIICRTPRPRHDRDILLHRNHIQLRLRLWCWFRQHRQILHIPTHPRSTTPTRLTGQPPDITQRVGMHPTRGTQQTNQHSKHGK